METEMANYKFDFAVNSPSLVTHIRSFELVLWCHELVVFHHGELRVFLFDLSKLRGQITQQRDIFHSTMTNNSWDPSMFSFRPPHTKKAIWKYRIVASRSTSRLVTCLGLYILLMKGIFGPYVLWPFDKKLIFWIVTRVSARDYTVYVH